jgi:hypothetical protein
MPRQEQKALESGMPSMVALDVPADHGNRDGTRAALLTLLPAVSDCKRCRNSITRPFRAPLPTASGIARLAAAFGRRNIRCPLWKACAG